MMKTFHTALALMYPKDLPSVIFSLLTRNTEIHFQVHHCFRFQSILVETCGYTNSFLRPHATNIPMTGFRPELIIDFSLELQHTELIK